MRILLAGKQHYDPGGIPSSNDQLARRLTSMGHDISVLAHVAYDGPQPPEAERWLVRPETGYPYEAWSISRLPPGAGLGVVARSFRPDVILVNAGGEWWHDWTRPLVDAAPEVPLVLYIRDTGALELLDDLAPRVDLVLANAAAHVDGAARLVPAVMVPSLIEFDRYRTEPTGEAVIYINPVPLKGVETAFVLAAARPDVPFHFRESWILPRRVAEEVGARAAALGNVEFLRSTTDTVEPYRRARVLLVPYEDLCRPRVIPEAHVSGIPVLARDDPALREAVGPGGLLVAPGAPIEAWAEALDELWDDAAAHGRYAQAARRHSTRAEIDAGRIATRFAEVLGSLVGRPARKIEAWEAADRPPVASVVVPVRNVAATIDDQLAALAHQSFREPWEVVVADNGSTDATRAKVEAWRDRLPDLRVVDASGVRGVAHGRNVGLRAARGDVLLICDGDDIVAPDWLANMAAALEDHPIVTGFIDIVTLNDPEQYTWTGDQTRDVVPVAYGHLPYVPGGNVGMWREVFESVGDFEEGMRRAEDIDFGWRAHELGIPVHFEPSVVLHRRMRSTSGDVFRSAVQGGKAEAWLHRRHRDQGMDGATWDEVRGQYRWLVKRVPAFVRGEADRHQWAHHAGKRVGRVVGSVRYRTRYL